MAEFNKNGVVKGSLLSAADVQELYRNSQRINKGILMVYDFEEVL